MSLQAVWLGDVPHDDGGEAELEGLQIVPVHLDPGSTSLFVGGYTTVSFFSTTVQWLP